MALNLNFSNETSHKIDQEPIKEILEKAVAESGVETPVEINVFVINEETMADLHSRFMKTRETTDVLSFPLLEKVQIEEGVSVDPDGVMRLGDIVICYEVAQKQGEKISFLARHGCLHLLGIHHEE